MSAGKRDWDPRESMPLSSPESDLPSPESPNADLSPHTSEQLLEEDDRAVVHLLGKARRIESLDYEICENKVHFSDLASRSQWDVRVYLGMRWVLGFMVAMIIAFVAFFINLCVENIAGWRFNATLALMRYSYFGGFVVFAVFSCSLAVAACAVTIFVGPAAAGSGIPDVKVYLNGVDAPDVLAPRTLLAKVVGSICAVSAGLAVGKEGPLVHIGACVAAQLVPTLSCTSWWMRQCSRGGIVGRVSRMLRNDRDKRDLVSMGAAAGVAAAFKAPVGGVLFALEEASSWMRAQLLWRVFFTTACVHIALRALRSWCDGGHCGHFGEGGWVIFNLNRGQFDYTVAEVVPVLFLGVVGGLVGSLFIYLNTMLTLKRRKLTNRQRLYEACAVALITAICSFVIPIFYPCSPCPTDLPNGTVCPRPEDSGSGNFVNFYCEGDSEYNPLATIFFNTQDDAIRNLFSTNTAEMYGSSTLVIFGLIYYGLAILTYGVVFPSGLFIPCILCGAAYGRLTGTFVLDYIDTRSETGIDEATYALLGAASFLGGAMRMTVSLVVILVELTNNVSYLPLLMMVLLVSKGVGDLFGKGIYDRHVELKAMPFLDEQPPGYCRQLQARDVMSKTPTSFNAVEQVAVILSALQNSIHNGFPVMGKDGVLIGTVLRSQLLVLLRARWFQCSSKPDSSRRELDQVDISAMELPPITVEELDLTPEEQQLHIDLTPFVNSNAYAVPESCSLSKAYNLFRSLGLRHLMVVKQYDQVTGMITRKDLVPDFAEVRFATRKLSTSDREERVNAVLRRRRQAAGEGLPGFGKGDVLGALGEVEGGVDLEEGEVEGDGVELKTVRDDVDRECGESSSSTEPEEKEARSLL